MKLVTNLKTRRITIQKDGETLRDVTWSFNQCVVQMFRQWWQITSMSWDVYEVKITKKEKVFGSRYWITERGSAYKT